MLLNWREDVIIIKQLKLVLFNLGREYNWCKAIKINVVWIEITTNSSILLARHKLIVRSLNVVWMFRNLIVVCCFCRTECFAVAIITVITSAMTMSSQWDLMEWWPQLQKMLTFPTAVPAKVWKQHLTLINNIVLLIEWLMLVIGSILVTCKESKLKNPHNRGVDSPLERTGITFLDTCEPIVQ